MGVWVGVRVIVGVLVCVIVGVMVGVGVNFTHNPVPRLQDASVTNVPFIHPPLEQLFEVPISTQAGTPHPSQQFSVVVESTALAMRGASTVSAMSAKTAATDPAAPLVVRLLLPSISTSDAGLATIRVTGLVVRFLIPSLVVILRGAAIRNDFLRNVKDKAAARPHTNGIALRRPRWHILR